MDFYTKVFLINLFVFFFSLGLDVWVLDDAIERVVGKSLLNLWANLTFISVPIWIVYCIVTA